MFPCSSARSLLCQLLAVTKVLWVQSGSHSQDRHRAQGKGTASGISGTCFGGEIRCRCLLEQLQGVTPAPSPP